MSQKKKAMKKVNQDKGDASEVSYLRTECEKLIKLHIATYTPDILGSQNTLTRINLPQRSSLQRTPEFGIDQAFNNFEELDLGLDFSGMGNDFDPSSGPSRPLNYGDGDMSAEAQESAFCFLSIDRRAS